MARSSRILAVLLVTLISLSPEAQAQEIPASQTTDQIMTELMSPYCPGRLLRDCPSGQALQLKEKIAARVNAGESREAIVEDLINTFGEEMRATPRARGFGLVAWVAPGLFLVLGGILIVVWLRNRSEESEAKPPLDADAEKRLSDLIE